MSVFNGGLGDDSFTGGAGSDTFNLADGGEDTATGGSGGDVFNLGAALSPGDRLDGGPGLDTLNLDGDYSAGVVFEAGTVTGFEQINLAAGHDYAFTFAAGTIAANGLMTISGGQASDSISIDDSAGLAGAQLSVSTLGSLSFTGGDANEILNIAAGAAQVTADLGGGVDGVVLSGAFLSGYAFHGGGQATLLIGSAGGARLNLTGAKLSGFNVIGLTGNEAYSIKIANDVMTPGAQLQVSLNSNADGSIIDGSKTHVGSLLLEGADNCTLIGGAGNDVFEMQRSFTEAIGGRGADGFAVGSGDATLVYSKVTDSTKAHADVISAAFDELIDTITIDLSAIDADTTQGGDQAFVLVGAFDHHAGELCLTYKAKTDMTLVQADVDGDGKADLVIQLTGDHHGFDGFVL